MVPWPPQPIAISRNRFAQRMPSALAMRVPTVRLGGHMTVANALASLIGVRSRKKRQHGRLWHERVDLTEQTQDRHKR